MKMRWNKKLIPSLNCIDGKSSPYGSKGVLRHYHYWSDPKLGPGVVEIRINTCSCHSCTKILSLPWDSTVREAFNHPIYGRVYNCKYSIIIDYHNNWIVMNFLDDGSGNVEYECINITILDANITNTYFLIIEENYGAIDDYYFTCHCYYIIRFSSLPYTL